MMRWKNRLVALCVSMFVAMPAYADFIVIPIDASSVPYGLSAANYANSPSNYANSSSNYANSSSNYSNSASNYTNSSSNYSNGMNGKSRLITTENQMIGYFVYSSDGVLNLYNSSGRIAYMPSGNTTQSFFLSEGAGWCGTIGQVKGETVIGMTTKCLAQFIAGD